MYKVWVFKDFQPTLVLSLCAQQTGMFALKLLRNLGMAF